MLRTGEGLPGGEELAPHALALLAKLAVSDLQKDRRSNEAGETQAAAHDNRPSNPLSVCRALLHVILLLALLLALLPVLLLLLFLRLHPAPPALLQLLLFAVLLCPRRVSKDARMHGSTWRFVGCCTLMFQEWKALVWA